MKDLNKFSFTGRLGKEPVLRHTPQQKPVCEATLAIGGFHDSTTWFDVVWWGKSAELAAQHLHKGSRIAGAGRIETDSWVDKTTGQNRTKHKLTIEEFTFLDSKPQQPQQQPQPQQQAYQPAPAYQPQQQSPAPAYQPQQQQYNQPVQGNQPVPGGDELPF